MITIITLLIIMSVCQLRTQDKMKEINKNKMSVRWQIEGDLICFEMTAPTNGWVAIGFNENENLSGAYLLMGRVRDDKAEVVEHYIDKPGSYQPIRNYGHLSQVKNISGTERKNSTILKFSVPIAAASKFHKNLHGGSQWTLIMAYSMSDDFQHHSIMRTSVNSKL